MFDDREIRKQIKDKKKNDIINAIVKRRNAINSNKQYMQDLVERYPEVQMFEDLMKNEKVGFYLSFDKNNYLMDIEVQMLLNEINALNTNYCDHPLYIACEGRDGYSCTCLECGQKPYMKKNTQENILVINGTVNIPEIRSDYYVFKDKGYSLDEIKDLLDQKYNKPKEKDKNLR